MFCDYTVGVNKIVTNKDNGYSVETLNYIKDIECDIQPYSKELLLKSYGYDIQCNKRILCEADSDIDTDTIFTYKDIDGNTKYYQIQKIINWDDLDMEIAVLEVGGERWNHI